MLHYIHLSNKSDLPRNEVPRPYKAVVIIEEDVAPEWQWEVSKWLVSTGCLCMMAWGKNATSWDDSVDFANLEKFDYGEITDSELVMTTWHDDESLLDVFKFSETCVGMMSSDLVSTLLLHVAKRERKAEIIKMYRLAQAS